MRRLLSINPWLYLLFFVLLLGAVLGQQYRLFERAWFSVQEWQHGAQWRDQSLWLGDYRVVIEAKSIADISDVSALTYDPDRRSLFSVTNKPAKVIEISLQGELKRTIDLEGFGDPEAIEYVAPGTYVIADEREQRLVKVRIDDATRALDAADFQQLSLGIGRNGNKGFEGLAYDAKNQRLLVAKERDPVRIFEVLGFPHVDESKPLALQVNTDPKRDARLFVRDLSSLDFDTATGHLLALSDESRLVIELNAEGKPISTLSLLRGQHGLQRSVPQAEGVATDDDGNLYLISEPNLFYVFRKQGD
ncbi:SdiA-regulated domain-containing protein [Ectopseudomonas toyotomiensis]|uniref:SdiA-regulated domain-containing protein n=1 Tax=Ectopseudomonas toyotomiensis TaxID=554344 RepID=A0AA42IM53_9GAMM|nr:SdiA-regulated domain-containing protein [Pseudomonas toyotomiensis]MBG0842296.1 SdiA-regulated domain-containing protein [Pseudomonas toyotomiensis]MDH0701980.1 SdiA-regulated domain-containing protein [Pseudomonas toyotomiensis]